MFDWQTKGCSRYGASMGRKSDLPLDFDGKIQIRHVPLDEGGYDPGGAYWGTPSDLYCAFDAEGRTYYYRGTPEGLIRLLPNATVEPIVEVTDADIDEMLEAYTVCALWSTCGDDPDYEGKPENNPGGVPLDENYSVDDIDEETVAKMRADVTKFATENAAVLLEAMRKRPKCNWSEAGHNLWLNRNGHGCGFGDGDYPDPEADILDEAARAMGEVWLYAGDDGKIHS